MNGLCERDEYLEGAVKLSVVFQASIGSLPTQVSQRGARKATSQLAIRQRDINEYQVET
jgi:hypothetical protein